MAFDFLKKIFNKEKEKKAAPVKIERGEPAAPAEKKEAEKMKSASPVMPAPPAKPAPVKKDKPLSEKTDDELAGEINKISPEILSQAKTPEQRKMVVNIYRKMLEDNVNINDEREVKKWLKKNPEVARGEPPAPKVETYKREEPKVGRNEPCPCGSGKKYKKCCGKEK